MNHTSEKLGEQERERNGMVTNVMTRGAGEVERRGQG